MNIVFLIDNPAVARSFSKTFRRLCSMGHSLTVVHGRYEKGHDVGGALRACRDELDNFSALPMLSRKKWRRLSNVREIIDYANYLQPRHPTPWEARRWRRQIMFKALSKTLKYSRFANRLMAGRGVFNLLKWIGRRIPPDPDIMRWMATRRPDVVVASPYIVPRTGEIDYVQAARALGIPTIAIVLSWDNLTTKGTFHIFPDKVFVWNEALAEEARQFHDVPADIITTTGAPVFDFWFDMRPRLDYVSFCSKAGISAKHSFVLYLCSSKYISGDETAFVKEFARALRQGEGTGNTGVLVRPHPLNAEIWDGIEDEFITVWPRTTSWVDTREAKQDYYHSIYHSRAVIGVNTSAIIEAAIVDRPCVTIVDEKYRFRQNARGHFRHLVNADFMEIAGSFSGSRELIAEILSGRDLKKDKRRRFVSDFIRPRGMERSASGIVADAIVSTGMKAHNRSVEQ